LSAIKELLDPIILPKVVKVKQKFERRTIPDIAKELLNRLKENKGFAAIKNGQKIAVVVAELPPAAKGQDINL